MANNTYPAEFIYDNISIQNNVIHTSYLNNVKKLLFVGSGCVYPKIVPQPIREDYLLTGPLEKTNESYAIAKIAGLKMCEAYNKQYGTDFISVMPCNVYGENDSYHLENAHVVPALIRKFHEAVENEKDNVEIWGTGKARREFIHVDDLADACVYLMSNYTSNDPINIGVGFDITIKDLANLIAEISKFKGKLIYDYSKPDGTPQKLLDSSKLISMGWKPKISLIEGLSGVYKAYKDNHLNYRK
jgi:GDP-L-fucose synthase